MSKDEKAIEAEIQTKRPPARRITPGMLDAEIAADQARAERLGIGPKAPVPSEPPKDAPLDTASDDEKPEDGEEQEGRDAA